ncbi:hypothetical protein C8F01DRAFT_1290781 [Mycena amicta]|nr:hypothetical protein C8F01DRAFT_1290781 [Mycena amicta]
MGCGVIQEGVSVITLGVFRLATGLRVTGCLSLVSLKSRGRPHPDELGRISQGRWSFTESGPNEDRAPHSWNSNIVTQLLPADQRDTILSIAQMDAGMADFAVRPIGTAVDIQDEYACTVTTSAARRQGSLAVVCGVRQGGAEYRGTRACAQLPPASVLGPIVYEECQATQGGGCESHHALDTNPKVSLIVDGYTRKIPANTHSDDTGREGLDYGGSGAREGCGDGSIWSLTQQRKRPGQAKGQAGKQVDGLESGGVGWKAARPGAAGQLGDGKCGSRTRRRKRPGQAAGGLESSGQAGERVGRRKGSGTRDHGGGQAGGRTAGRREDGQPAGGRTDSRQAGGRTAGRREDGQPAGGRTDSRRAGGRTAGGREVAAGSVYRRLPCDIILTRASAGARPNSDFC